MASSHQDSNGGNGVPTDEGQGRVVPTPRHPSQPRASSKMTKTTTTKEQPWPVGRQPGPHQGQGRHHYHLLHLPPEVINMIALLVATTPPVVRNVDEGRDAAAATSGRERAHPDEEARTNGGPTPPPSSPSPSPPLPPPTHLRNLVLTCRALHDLLCAANNAHLYASVFRHTFDAAALERRLGPALFEGEPARWRDELRRRCVVLKRMRGAVERGELWPSERGCPGGEEGEGGQEREEGRGGFGVAWAARQQRGETRSATRPTTTTAVTRRMRRKSSGAAPGERRRANDDDDDDEGEEEKEEEEEAVMPEEALREVEENLWLAYLMMTENDGLNLRQLRWARLEEYLALHRAKRLVDLNNIHTFARATPDRSLALQLAYLLSEPARLARESHDEGQVNLFVLRPFVFAAHKYDAFLAPWTVRCLPMPAPPPCDDDEDRDDDASDVGGRRTIADDDEAVEDAAAGTAAAVTAAAAAAAATRASSSSAASSRSSTPQTTASDPWLANAEPAATSRNASRLLHCGRELRMLAPLVSLSALRSFFLRVENDPGVLREAGEGPPADEEDEQTILARLRLRVANPTAATATATAAGVAAGANEAGEGEGEPTRQQQQLQHQHEGGGEAALVPQGASIHAHAAAAAFVVDRERPTQPPPSLSPPAPPATAGAPAGTSSSATTSRSQATVARPAGGGGGSTRLPRRYPLQLCSRDHDLDYLRMACCHDAYSSPGLPARVHRGRFEGCWEGRFCFFEFNHYRNMLRGRVGDVYEGPFGEQPQVWRLREHWRRVRPRRSEEGDGERGGAGGESEGYDDDDDVVDDLDEEGHDGQRETREDEEAEAGHGRAARSEAKAAKKHNGWTLEGGSGSMLEAGFGVEADEPQDALSLDAATTPAVTPAGAVGAHPAAAETTTDGTDAAAVGDGGGATHADVAARRSAGGAQGHDAEGDRAGTSTTLAPASTASAAVHGGDADGATTRARGATAGRASGSSGRTRAEAVGTYGVRDALEEKPVWRWLREIMDGEVGGRGAGSAGSAGGASGDARRHGREVRREGVWHDDDDEEAGKVDELAAAAGSRKRRKTTGTTGRQREKQRAHGECDAQAGAGEHVGEDAKAKAEDQGRMDHENADDDDDDDGEWEGRAKEEEQDDEEEERYEILLSGTGHSAWGRFILRGRVRSWDGMMVLAKDYVPAGRGRWLYRGYALAGDHLAGRWRDAFTPEDMSGYEGVWQMYRRST